MGRAERCHQLEQQNVDLFVSSASPPISRYCLNGRTPECRHSIHFYNRMGQILVKFKGDPTKIPKFIGLPLLSDEQQDMLELLFATKH